MASSSPRYAGRKHGAAKHRTHFFVLDDRRGGDGQAPLGMADARSSIAPFTTTPPGDCTSTRKYHYIIVTRLNPRYVSPISLQMGPWPSRKHAIAQHRILHVRHCRLSLPSLVLVPAGVLLSPPARFPSLLHCLTLATRLLIPLIRRFAERAPGTLHLARSRQNVISTVSLSSVIS